MGEGVRAGGLLLPCRLDILVEARWAHAREAFIEFSPNSLAPASEARPTLRREERLAFLPDIPNPFDARRESVCEQGRRPG